MYRLPDITRFLGAQQRLVTDQWSGPRQFVASGADGCFKNYDAMQHAPAFVSPCLPTAAHITEDYLK